MEDLSFKNKSLHGEIDRLKNENIFLHKLLCISSLVNETNKVQEILSELFINGIETVNAKKGSILVLDENKNILKIKIAKGLHNEIIKNTKIKIGHGISGIVAKEKKPILFNKNDDKLNIRLKRSDPSRITSFMSIPLKIRSDIIGVLNISDPVGKEHFTIREFELIKELCAQAVMVIETCQLNTKMNKFANQAILALSQAIEAKDSYTEGHCERVTKIAYTIAKEYGDFTDNELIIIQYGAMLHDIGKIGIDPLILNKPDKLTPAEYEEIKKHPEIGAQIISPITFFDIVKTCIKYHHVWFDGSGGYPVKENDDETDKKSKIMANIIGVADVYDAMISDRPYRKKLDHNTVKKHLIEGRGSQFDPKAVDILLYQIESSKNFESSFLSLI